MLKRSKRYLPYGLLLALAVSTFSACATQEVDGALPQLPESEAALLDGAEAATPVADTSSSVFADLAPTSIPEGMEASGDGLAKDSAPATVSNDAFSNLEAAGASEPADSVTGTVAASTEASASDNADGPFYRTIGGEKLGHVAYILYGSRAKAKMLKEQNPSLEGAEKLAADQKVFFKFEGLRPQARLLTKDLIDRYPAELAGELERATRKEAKSKAVVGKGETLQALSQRLYGTTRYWTEIYLLNQGMIKSYDKVPAGLELTVIQRDPASIAAPQAPKAQVSNQMPKPVVAPAPAPVAEQKPAAPAPKMTEMANVNFETEVKPAEQPQPMKQAEPVQTPPPAMDPIPETPSAPVVQAPPMTNFAATQPEAAPASNGPTMSVKDFFANGANVRRVIYVVAILVIGIAAFFLTRTKKKSFDMLDMTTSDTAPRPKLNSKDDKKFG